MTTRAKNVATRERGAASGARTRDFELSLPLYSIRNRAFCQELSEALAVAVDHLVWNIKKREAKQILEGDHHAADWRDLYFILADELTRRARCYQ